MKVYVVFNDQGDYGVNIVSICDNEESANAYSSKKAESEIFGSLYYRAYSLNEVPFYMQNTK